MDPTDARRVVIATCRDMGVDVDAVLGRDRRPRVVEARRECMFAVRRSGGSNTLIACMFGRARGTVGEILSPNTRRVATRPVRG